MIPKNCKRRLEDVFSIAEMSQHVALKDYDARKHGMSGSQLCG